MEPTNIKKRNIKVLTVCVCVCVYLHTNIYMSSKTRVKRYFS
jgi:hypothetical protein